MQGDFSRVTFDPAKHFSAVLTQQGRVPLDADANEQGAILLRYLRQLTIDLVGPAWTPAGDGSGGFEIGPTGGSATHDLTIGPGHFYVDGVLCENDQATTYLTQPDGHLDPSEEQDLLPDGGLPYLVYLRVWERLVTAVEDSSIREIALGDLAPDTAARARVVWQVACHEYDPEAGDPVQQWRDWLADLHEPKGQLAAQAQRPDDAAQNVCDLSPQASFRGPENQLYRVEVHTGGVAAQPQGITPGTATKAGRGPYATFKWSRENGSVVLPIASASGTEIEVATLGRDGKLALEVGDWVEVVDEAYACRVADDVQPEEGTPPLRRVLAIDPVDRLVTLDGPVANCGPGTDTGLHPLLRRWDHRTADRDGLATDSAIPVVEGKWIDLEDGVQVRFDPPSADPGGSPTGGAASAAGKGAAPAMYRRGDYWLIPARTVTGDVVWPQGMDGPQPQRPHGVEYHYAPLAWITEGGKVTDLRQVFLSLTRKPGGAPDGAGAGTAGQEAGPDEPGSPAATVFEHTDAEQDADDDADVDGGVT